MISLSDIIAQLEQAQSAILSLVSGVTQEQAQWKPAPKRWSVLEVMNHMADLENEDFGFILKIILYETGQKWPGFDETEWITSRQYNQRRIDESLHRFKTVRGDSITWLKGLNNIDLNKSRQDGKIYRGGPMRAGDILIAWIAHDLFHIRQLALLRHDILGKWSKPFSAAYSGFTA